MMVLRQLAFLLLPGVATGQAQVVVDRMVAVVNKRVIMESQLDQEVRLGRLLEGKPPAGDKLDFAEKSQALEQLIDRELLEQQIPPSDMETPSPEELARRLKEIRAREPGLETEAGWKARLAADDLTLQDVERRVISEFSVLYFIDMRFRGLVRVDKAAIAAYYQDKFLPQLRNRGAPEPALAAVSDQIEKILVEQRVDEMLNDWIKALRAQAQIDNMLIPPNRPGPGANP
ncbi:MAG TPA: SurA N-terminal domain-containing protein [Candidatus Angelobacter sp.]|nr:SurA N-terminal domain-containing protein [Candidatus Angelobacter sp.]